MNTSNALVPLDQIVNMAINQMSLGDGEYFQLYQLALRELKKINRSFAGDFKEVQIVPNANGTCPLPDDFLREIGVGLINGLGEFFPFRKNKLITRNLDEDCDRLNQETIGPISPPFTRDNGSFGAPYPYSLGGQYGSLGVGSDRNFGTYDIDIDSNLILFDFNLSQLNPYGNIVIRYLPVLGSCDGDIMVHESLVEVLIAFMYWKYITPKRQVSGFDKSEAKKDYYNLFRLARLEYRRVDFQQIIQNYRRNQRSAPKA